MDDEKFEEHIGKMQEYVTSIARTEGPASAYIMEMKRLEGNEKNFSVKSRMMDMRKSVNHPYLIEYPVTEDGMFYDSGPDMVDICGKLQVFDQMIVKLVADGHKTLIFSQVRYLNHIFSFPTLKICVVTFVDDEDAGHSWRLLQLQEMEVLSFGRRNEFHR